MVAYSSVVYRGLAQVILCKIYVMYNWPLMFQLKKESINRLLNNNLRSNVYTVCVAFSISNFVTFVSLSILGKVNVIAIHGAGCTVANL